METDAKLQRTIQTQFVSSTLLCIVHRLKTVGKCHCFKNLVPPDQTFLQHITIVS